MNKKTMIVAVAGLLAGLGGGTGFKIATAPPPAEAVDVEHAAADSTSAHGDETADHASDTAQVDDGHAAPASTAETLAANTHASEPATDAHAATAQPTVEAPAKVATVNASAEQLGRLLGVMKPEEAARILEPLSDEQVKKLLFQLSDRKAAAILAKFKGDRAAALARAIIEHEGQS
jgi:flagellar motility protein MotE (MotC chaperone)